MKLAIILALCCALVGCGKPKLPSAPRPFLTPNYDGTELIWTCPPGWTTHHIYGWNDYVACERPSEQDRREQEYELHFKPIVLHVQGSAATTGSAVLAVTSVPSPCTWVNTGTGTTAFYGDNFMLLTTIKRDGQ